MIDYPCYFFKNYKYWYRKLSSTVKFWKLFYNECFKLSNDNFIKFFNFVIFFFKGNFIDKLYSCRNFYSINYYFKCGKNLLAFWHPDLLNIYVYFWVIKILRSYLHSFFYFHFKLFLEIFKIFVNLKNIYQI